MQDLDDQLTQGEVCKNGLSQIVDEINLVENFLQQDSEKSHQQGTRFERESRPSIHSPKLEEETKARMSFCLSGESNLLADNILVQLNGCNYCTSPDLGLETPGDCAQTIAEAEKPLDLHKQHVYSNTAEKDFRATISTETFHIENSTTVTAEKCLKIIHPNEKTENIHTKPLSLALVIENKEKIYTLQGIDNKIFELVTRNPTKEIEEINGNKGELCMLTNKQQLKGNETPHIHMDLHGFTDNNLLQKEEVQLMQNEAIHSSLLQHLKELATKQEEIHCLEKKYGDVKDTLLLMEENSKACVNELKLLKRKYSNLKNHARLLEVERHLNAHIKENMMEMKRKVDIENINIVNECNALQKENEALVKSSEVSNKQIHYLKQNMFRLIEEKQMLEECIKELQEKNQELEKHIQYADTENERTNRVMSTKDLQIKMLITKLRDAMDDLKTLEINVSEYEVETRTLSFQIEQIKLEKIQLQQEIEYHSLESTARNQSADKHIKSLQNECKALSKMVSDLKEDKNLLRGELHDQLKEKSYIAAEKSKCCKELEKLGKVAHGLERERDVLKKELTTMQSDYLSLSDSISKRLNIISAEGKKPSFDQCLPDISLDKPCQECHSLFQQSSLCIH
ncbi:coiled-coil domain-containing protein 110-like [Ambystoma mexicanum]|uniref:coiled-coil domain-containing protein 110-like n=1 Tax=Ambystoma mexicanum TaxID=8296 RepID=UPI0037E860C8